MLSVHPKQTLSMLTRDRVRLDADVYYPNSEGTFPVLLMRQPYGRSIASTVVYAHPTWYAAHGYIVVIQDVRGRGTSEGEFSLFAHEMADGYDTVNWVATLPNSTGAVGMYGFSYQGMTQLYAAATQPPALNAICPAMVGYDLYADWAYEGGAFCLQANLGWAIQLEAETARLRGDSAAYHALFAASRHLPLHDPTPARPQILQELAPDSFYHTWLDHPEPDEYWEILSPKRYLTKVDLPMLHIGGWFDTFLRGTLHLYREMQARCTQPQKLVVGPWAHLPWGRRVGAIDYGIAAVSLIDRWQIDWFNQFLKSQDTGVVQTPSIHLFEMGTAASTLGNCWRTFATCPTPEPSPYFLVSSGLAGISEQSGRLTELGSALPNNSDILVHDPWRSVPALGGHAVAPSGAFDRAALDCRSDILTYTSASLATDLHLAGEIAVELYCTADAPSFDLCAVLSEVRSDGKVYNFSQGYRRVDQGDTQAIQLWTLQLQATCTVIPAGHALRLSLSAACFPAYPVNPGTGAFPGAAQLIDAKIITLTVYSGETYPSQVLLPVLPEGKLAP